MILPYATHRLEHIYPDPERFDPERFGDGAPHQNPYAFLPFSAGPRNCIGYKFAYIEMKTVIARVLQNFHLSPAPGKEEVQPIFRMTLRARGGLWRGGSGTVRRETPARMHARPFQHPLVGPLQQKAAGINAMLERWYRTVAARTMAPDLVGGRDLSLAASINAPHQATEQQHAQHARHDNVHHEQVREAVSGFSFTTTGTVADFWGVPESVTVASSRIASGRSVRFDTSHKVAVRVDPEQVAVVALQHERQLVRPVAVGRLDATDQHRQLLGVQRIVDRERVERLAEPWLPHVGGQHVHHDRGAGVAFAPRQARFDRKRLTTRTDTKLFLGERRSHDTVADRFVGPATATRDQLGHLRAGRSIFPHRYYDGGQCVTVRVVHLRRLDDDRARVVSLGGRQGTPLTYRACGWVYLKVQLIFRTVRGHDRVAYVGPDAPILILGTDRFRCDADVTGPGEQLAVINVAIKLGILVVRIEHTDRDSMYFFSTSVPSSGVTKATKSEYGPGSVWYSTVEYGPGWSRSCALMPWRILQTEIFVKALTDSNKDSNKAYLVPITVTSERFSLYGAPIHIGALSFTSVTQKDTFTKKEPKPAHHTRSLTASSENLRSQITFTKTADGPIRPSLSSGFATIRSFVPGAMYTGESFSRSVSTMSLPGSPSTRRLPTTAPTVMSSFAKKFTADPPPSR
uniref:Cytochrome P450 n=1 Tax=Anopheles coluzzii TaxID=1518534 RepID=A0A8W7PC86_ANOCL